MAKVADLIKKDMPVIIKLAKIGAVSPNLINAYNIYVFYESLSNEPSKMNRYTFTADSLRIDERTVMRAIKQMEKAA